MVSLTWALYDITEGGFPELKVFLALIFFKVECEKEVGDGLFSFLTVHRKTRDRLLVNTDRGNFAS